MKVNDTERLTAGEFEWAGSSKDCFNDRSLPLRWLLQTDPSPFPNSLLEAPILLCKTTRALSRGSGCSLRRKGNANSLEKKSASTAEAGEQPKAIFAEHALGFKVAHTL